MQIDWFTVIAQIVNFLLLVYLLKRFLYGPIVRAMDRREQRVTERLRGADEREENAAREAQAYQQKRKELEERRREALEKAREEAESQRKALLEEARHEIEDQRKRWRDELEREKEAFSREMRTEVALGTVRALRRALGDLAEAQLEEQIVGVFIARLRELDQKEREELARAVDSTQEPIRVASAFELSKKQRDAVRKALEDRLERSLDLHFAATADVICGIELRTPGSRLAWSVDDYLEELEERVAESLRDRARPIEGRAMKPFGAPVEAAPEEAGEDEADS